jgi:hypothetical protein
LKADTAAPQRRQPQPGTGGNIDPRTAATPQVKPRFTLGSTEREGREAA